MTRTPSPPAPVLPLPDIRLLGIPLASVLDAIPDGVLAYLFFRGVFWPQRAGVEGIHWLGMIMLIEFLIIHSSAFIGGLMVSDAPRRKRALGALGLTLFYLLFAAGMSAGFHSWVPVLILGGLTLNRLLFIFLRDPRSMTPLDQQAITTQWVFGGAAFVLSMMLGALLVNAVFVHLWDARVYERYFVLSGDMEGTLDVPIVAGLFYFTASAVRALFFSRDLGAPGYRARAVPPVNRVVLGIHAGLGYLVGRQTAAVLFVTAFLSVFCYFMGFIGIAFTALFLSLLGWAQVINYRWLRRATALLATPPVHGKVRVLDDPGASRNITRIHIPRLDAEWRVEPVRRRNVLPPGDDSVDAEIFASPDARDLVVLRVGRTYLCTLFPTTPEERA